MLFFFVIYFLLKSTAGRWSSDSIMPFPPYSCMLYTIPCFTRCTKIYNRQFSILIGINLSSEKKSCLQHTCSLPKIMFYQSHSLHCLSSILILKEMRLNTVLHRNDNSRIKSLQSVKAVYNYTCLHIEKIKKEINITFR